MSSAVRVRVACQSCHTRGYFRPVETMWRSRGAWEWRRWLLCAVCRLHLQTALLEGRLRQAPGLARAAIAEKRARATASANARA